MSMAAIPCLSCGETHPNETTPTPYAPPEHLPPAVIFDIDGTLALRGERCPYDNGPAVLGDAPNPPVIELAWGLHKAGNQIVIVSGRQEKCRAETREWLSMHLPATYAGLFMRPTGDQRPDYEIKAEMWERIRHKWAVWLAVDDRDQVVSLWRELGLVCAQVAPGAF